MHSVEMAGQITEVLLFFVSTCGGLGLRSFPHYQILILILHIIHMAPIV